MKISFDNIKTIAISAEGQESSNFIPKEEFFENAPYPADVFEERIMELVNSGYMSIKTERDTMYCHLNMKQV